MTDGIAALEGFDYQSMVALELVHKHFAVHPAGRARPEGVDDLDLEYRDDEGITRRIHVQVKKPRQDSEGSRTPRPWSLREVVESLLWPRWSELQDARNEIWWVLGDTLGDDASALLGIGDDVTTWAARRAAAEWIVREQRSSAKSPTTSPDWQSPFRAGADQEDTVEGARQRWTTSYEKRAARADIDPSTVANWVSEIDRTHDVIDKVMPRARSLAAHGEAADLRAQLTATLSKDFGLAEQDVSEIVFRNLRGFVDDIARAREVWISLPMLHDEIVRVWPRRVATVLPPPLPVLHLPRPKWIEGLSRRSGALIGPSGSGKTTTATELFHCIRANEPNALVLYAEARSDTQWQNVLEGVACSVGRRGQRGPYELLPSLRSGHEEALLRLADALEESAVPIALLVDLVDGAASETFVRDIARFAQRLPANPNIRLWVFGQEDPLAELSDAERNLRGLSCTSIAGLEWNEFVALANLHGLNDLSGLRSIYDSLTSGRDAGIQPRVADAVLRLGSIESALTAARSKDVLLHADTRRYERLPRHVQEALGALACIAHPFRVKQAEAIFPTACIEAGVHAGVRVALLHSLGDERAEFHETVRRNVLAQLSAAVRVAHHTRLADVSAEQGDRVLEAHYADLAGASERSREAGRAAFFDPSTANSVATRAIARKWVTAAETLALLRADPQAPFGWWRALHRDLDDETAQELLSWWRTLVHSESPGNHLWPAPQALVAARPDLLPSMLDIAAASPSQGGHHFGASALGLALRDYAFDEALVVKRFDGASATERRALAETLQNSGSAACVARWLTHVIEVDEAPTLPASGKNLSAAHVLSIIDAMPALDAFELLLHGDWGFGAAMSFLQKHRESIGDHAERFLQDSTLASRRACVAMRLLGATGHKGLFEASRRRWRQADDVQMTALVAPLLVDEVSWRNELAAYGLDPSIDLETKVAIYTVYVQSGDGGEALLGPLVETAPDLERLCRLLTGMSFMSRPSLFALDLLVEQLLRDGTKPSIHLIGAGISRAAYFADGPYADAVADRILPLLAVPSIELRVAVLQALTMLRHAKAREPCARLAVAEASTVVGGLAAVAAAASHPQELTEVREALDANRNCGWLRASLAAHFGDASETRALAAEAEDVTLPWVVRRRALLALERLPHDPAVDRALESVLAERPLLIDHDSMNGQVSTLLVWILKNDGAGFMAEFARGEEPFVESLAAVLRDQHADYPKVTSEQIDQCLRLVWHAVHAQRSSGATPGATLASVLNSIQCSQVQHAALRVAYAFSNVELLERTMATSASSWLVYRALLERAAVEPRMPTDAARLAQLISDGPCGADEPLQLLSKRILEWLSGSESSAQRTTSAPARRLPVLTADDLIALAEGQSETVPRVRLADIANDEMERLVECLDPTNDSLVTVVQAPRGATISLTEEGYTQASRRIQTTGRKGCRRQLRAKLAARFPDRVPVSWFDKLNRDFASA